MLLLAPCYMYDDTIYVCISKLNLMFQSITYSLLQLS